MAKNRFEFEFTFQDPFAGDLVGYGATIEEAVADTYEDIPVDERPAYVWWVDGDGERRRISVPGGTCTPVF